MTASMTADTEERSLPGGGRPVTKPGKALTLLFLLTGYLDDS